MKKDLQALIGEFRAQPDCAEYTAHNGKKCLRTFGPIAWYFLKCAESGTDAEYKDGSYSAKGSGFELEFVEGDIILAFD